MQPRDYLAAARDIVPLIHQSRPQLDSDRKLPQPLVSALDEAGLLRMALPCSMGGPEVDQVTMFQVAEELAKADGSVAWCLGLSNVGAMFTGYLEASVARKLFGSPPDFRAAGSLRPEGEAKKVAGGYRVTGRWDYASGINHSSFLFINCRLVDEKGPCLSPQGTPEAVMVFTPSKHARIIDTWHTMGLCATGSNDFTLDDVFVPADHSFQLSRQPVETGTLYHPRLFQSNGWSIVAANALGMGRGAIDSFIELAGEAGTTMSTTPLRGRPEVQSTIGEVEAIISGCRNHVLTTIQAAWEAVMDRDSDPTYPIAQTRLAITHAVRESVRAVDLLFHAAGTNSIHRRLPLERHFRDCHVLIQHVAGLASNYTSGGQVMLGLKTTDRGW